MYIEVLIEHYQKTFEVTLSNGVSLRLSIWATMLHGHTSSESFCSRSGLDQGMSLMVK